MSATSHRLSEAFRFAFSSRRTLAVTLLSFSSGLPLGLVWIAIPDWMRSAGADIRIVGMITLAHAPWIFKMLWSPLMDRYSPGWWGRRRGWISLAQIALFALSLSLAGLGDHPDAPWVLLALATAIAFASASQDIAFDAYVVDVLHPEEIGVATGARLSSYRIGMWLAGGISITLAGWFSWPVVCLLLGLLYLPLLAITWRAPEPDTAIEPPPTLREAVWLPFIGFLSRHRALSILALVFLYKLADNLSQSLLRPFLIDMGYNAVDRGLVLATVGFWATLIGTFLGAALTSSWGLGRCLWLFGFLQIFSNVGYILVAHSDINRPLMYGAMIFEHATTGSGMGAFGVLLLRLTQKRFSATQYALYSSLFALPRMLAGPVTGFIVHAVGWTWFFWFTMAAGIPGLILLARFVPIGTREPSFGVEDRPPLRRLARGQVARYALVGGIGGAAVALLVMAFLGALTGVTADPEAGFDFLAALQAALEPSSVKRVIGLLGVLVFGIISALFTAAVVTARRR